MFGIFVMLMIISMLFNLAVASSISDYILRVVSNAIVIFILCLIVKLVIFVFS